MKFLPLHFPVFHKEVEFGNIVGYDDIKDLVRRALDSDENYNLLLCGPPASAKTLTKPNQTGVDHCCLTD